jgi:DNA-binding SARP family transcriptional activator
LVRLAESRESCGREETAVADLERAIEIDPYAEELYRRLMELNEKRERPDAVVALWQRLQRNLAELGLDPEPVTVSLYRALVDDRCPLT